MNSKQMAVVEILRKAFEGEQVMTREEIRQKVGELKVAGLKELANHLNIPFKSKVRKQDLISLIKEKIELLEDVEKETKETWVPLLIDLRFEKEEEWKKGVMEVWKATFDEEHPLDFDENLESWKPGVMAIIENLVH